MLEGYLMVNNDPIIWTMLNAIKEQQKEIVELKRQIRQLRTTRTTRRRTGSFSRVNFVRAALRGRPSLLIQFQWKPRHVLAGLEFDCSLRCFSFTPQTRAQFFLIRQSQFGCRNSPHLQLI